MQKYTVVLQKLLLFLIIFFLPVQLGKHFWPDFSYLMGVKTDYLSPVIYFTDILVFLLFIVSLFKTLQNASFGKNRINKIAVNLRSESGKIILYFFILLFFLVNIYSAKSPVVSTVFFFRILEMFFLSRILINNLGTTIKMRPLVLFLAASVFFESVLSILQFISQHTIGGLWWFLGERTFDVSTPLVAKANINGAIFLRAYGSFSHPNTLAGFLVIVLTFLIINIQENIFRGFGKVLILITAIIGSLALFLTFSRTSWIIYVLVLLYFFLKKFGRNKNILLIVLTTSAGIIYFISRIVFSRFVSLYDIDAQSIIVRIQLNAVALKMFTDHPLFGVGLNNFLINLPGYWQPQGVIRFFQPVHNIFLLIAAETGVFGLIIFLFINFYIIKRLFQKTSLPFCFGWDRHTNNYFILILLIFYALGLFDHYFFTQVQGQFLIILIYSMCGAAGSKIKKGAI